MIRPRSLPLRALAATFALLALALARPAAAESPDYSGWQGLLDRYVVVLGGSRDTYDTRVDFARCYTDERQAEGLPAHTLDAVREQLLAVPPSRMTPKERLAWAINTYNFLVFDRIARHVTVRVKRELLRYGDVREVVSGAGGFFDTDVVQVDGRGYSLERFERVFVYGDSTLPPEPRHVAGDARLMCALSRGTLGGPPLQRRAFRPDSLDAQLDFAARTYVQLPRIVSVEPKTKQIAVSEYFVWHALDLGGTNQWAAFVERWGTKDARNLLRREKPVQPSRWIEYDWSIAHSKFHVDDAPHD